MKYNKWIIGGMLGAFWLYLLTLCLLSHAATVEPEIKTGTRKYIQRVEFFSGFNVGDTYGTTTGYVYDSPNLTGVNDGWIDVNGNPLAKATKITVQIGVDSIASGTRTARIEGRGGKASRPFEIYSASYSAATSIDEVIPIQEGVTDLRIGWNCSVVTADSVHAYALIEKSE